MASVTGDAEDWADALAELDGEQQNGDLSDDWTGALADLDDGQNGQHVDEWAGALAELDDGTQNQAHVDEWADALSELDVDDNPSACDQEQQDILALPSGPNAAAVQVATANEANLLQMYEATPKARICPIDSKCAFDLIDPDWTHHVSAVVESRFHDVDRNQLSDIRTLTSSIALKLESQSWTSMQDTLVQQGGNSDGDLRLLIYLEVAGYDGVDLTIRNTVSRRQQGTIAGAIADETNQLCSTSLLVCER